ncbi:tyrosine-type recombinase/integrase [Lysinibacillus fusiformis]|uniref:tyrosine-type recombinase/integrase n=1 Tax=Lysinibacillus fusiformis TaxID=28031 RepID=UPI001245F5CA|nr:tyrosine-type recombinase/integrase [Lysinibacillus fusiformis]KAB0441027.1 hypothetical protein CH314_20765 [Lysinibacillus fusiformis]
MELKLNLSSVSDNLVMKKLKKVNALTFNENEYKEMFNNLVQINLIKGKYKLSTWEIFDELQDMFVEFSFDMGGNNSLQNYLKWYVLLRLQANKQTMTIYNEKQNIKKCILDNDGLKNSLKLEIFLHEEYMKSKNNGGNIASDLKQFLKFIKIKNKDELISICEKFPQKKYLNRSLPKLQDVLKFDEIINDYFRYYGIESTFRYLPIMLWWLITNIIPQRPTEFLLLKKDCLFHDQIDDKNKYFITIYRIKNDNNEESIEIDKTSYNIINNLINEITTHFNNDSPYLFTVDFYYYNRPQKHKRSKSNHRLNRRDFYSILDDFYHEVVSGLYQVNEIEKVKFGDTRHFAIINMCLQGFNMLSVANMAGHQSIYTQNEYFSHAKHFATSYVYIMAQKKLGYSFTKNFSGGLVGWKRYMYDIGKTISYEELDFEEIVGQIDYGICTELKKEFPMNCIGDCRFCNKYYFKPTISEFEEGVEWLINGSNQMKFKIENAIDFMKDIVTNSINNNNRAAQNLLQTTSRNLVSYMDLKAIVDAKILESDKNNEF